MGRRSQAGVANRLNSGSESKIAELGRLRVGVGGEAGEYENIEGQKQQHNYQYECHVISVLPAPIDREWQ